MTRYWNWECWRMWVVLIAKELQKEVSECGGQTEIWQRSKIWFTLEVSTQESLKTKDTQSSRFIKLKKETWSHIHSVCFHIFSTFLSNLLNSLHFVSVKQWHIVPCSCKLRARQRTKGEKKEVWVQRPNRAESVKDEQSLVLCDEHVLHIWRWFFSSCVVESLGKWAWNVWVRPGMGVGCNQAAVRCIKA